MKFDGLAICYFVDVGFGTCQVVYLGEGRALVIDAGPPLGKKKNILQQILRKCGVDRIEALVVSHNDRDHLGNAITIFNQYKGNIGKIAYLQDGWGRRSEDTYQHWRSSIRQAITEGHLSRDSVRRLETTSVESTSLYSNGATNAEDKVDLKLLYPDFITASEASEQDNHNEACAILVLEVGSCRIFFSGDAPLGAWHLIHRDCGGATITADVMSMPHHGGEIGGTSEDLQKLYSKIVRPSWVVVSVGQHDRYRLPNGESISAAIESGAKLVCTQMTPKCYGDSIQYPFNFPGNPGSGQNTDPVRTCGGTVQFSVYKDHVVMDSPNFEDHRKRISKLEHPLCMLNTVQSKK